MGLITWKARKVRKVGSIENVRVSQSRLSNLVPLQLIHPEWRAFRKFKLCYRRFRLVLWLL